MLTYSDNAAANGTEAYFGGSTSGGSALVNSLMRSVGLVDTEMYGGYELDAFGEPRRFLAGRSRFASTANRTGGGGRSRPRTTWPA